MQHPNYQQYHNADDFFNSPYNQSGGQQHAPYSQQMNNGQYSHMNSPYQQNNAYNNSQNSSPSYQNYPNTSPYHNPNGTSYPYYQNTPYYQTPYQTNVAPTKKKGKAIGIALIATAFLVLAICAVLFNVVSVSIPFLNIQTGNKITNELPNVETVGGTQSVVADSLEIEDEDYWIAKVTSQDVENWSVGGDSSNGSSGTPFVTDNAFFPGGKIMYSYLNMPDNTRYVMESLTKAAESGKVYDEDDYSTYEYYAGGFNEDIDFAYDAFDYNMSDYPLTLAYIASPDFMHFYYSDKGFFMFDSELFGTGCNFNQIYKQVDDKAQSICDECWDKSQGNEVEFITNVYHTLAKNMTYSDGINDTVHSNDIYGALVEGESKCAGMSGAMKYILDKKGIPNIIGFTDRTKTPATEEGHAWNIIYLDGQWLCCDLTIASKVYSDYGGYYPEDELARVINENAFLIPQDQFCAIEGIIVSDNVYALERYAEQNLL